MLAPGYEGSDALARELQDHVKAVTAPYKYPREIEFVDVAAEDDLGQDPPQRAARALVTPLPPFAIERYFAVHEFAVPYLLCASDVERALAARAARPRRRRDARALGRPRARLHRDARLAAPAARDRGLYETLAADDVIAVVGASEALFVLFSALVRPGDHVVALWPAYQSLYDLARAQGAEVELVELRPEDGWALDLDRIAAALRPTTRAVVVNLPHNPTGMHPSAARVRRARASSPSATARRSCATRSTAGSSRIPARRLPAAADRSPSAVSVGVLSKSYALAGLRVGWLATRDRELLDAVAQVRDYTSLCSPAPSEVLGVIALRAAEALIERSRGIIAANLPLVDELLAAHAERLDWVRPKAGSIGFPRYRGSEGIDAFNDRLVREQGVLLLPGQRLRLRRRALPPRLRPPESARGGGAARPPVARVSVYDRIGDDVRGTRRPDERIARQITAALGDARSVVNVGAGVGSYEPPTARSSPSSPRP